jgi:hypothetical protein
VQFYITIKIGYKDYKLKVVRSFADNINEEFTITSRSQTIILKNNRPFFRNKGLKHRRADWDIIKNDSKIYQSIIKDIITKINNVID